MSLSVREHMVLDLERRHFKYQGAKDAAIRHELGWSPTRHYQVLNRLLDDPGALQAHAQLVHRLRRVRETRRALRDGSAGAA